MPVREIRKAVKYKIPKALAAGDFKPKYYDLKNTRAHKNVFHRYQPRIFMKQQVIEGVNIMPQLDRACGLDMHKDKIIGFISCKDGSNQEFREFGTYTCELRKSEIGYRKTTFIIA
jgi:hypothetical protein